MNFMDSKYCSSRGNFIPDNFSSLDQVTFALRDAGLESSNLILGIDFTKSNEWTGRHSFGRRSLHAIGSIPNPYEQAISIIGRTLSSFDEDSLIPCFGFGDATTRDQYVFSFYPDDCCCCGFEEVLARYREIVPLLNLSGPTSFAPLIYASIDIVKRSNFQYHVLVIIADGQVSGNSHLPYGKLGPQERATIDSIVAASFYPLSIIMVGVGDGPWDAMQRFDDCIPHRTFDNFQFVNFTKIMASHMDIEKKETSFALAALMEIPFQYRAAQGLRPRDHGERSGSQIVIPPPHEIIEHDSKLKSLPRSNTFQASTKSKTYETHVSKSFHAASAEPVCPICFENPKDMAFGCGHVICQECSKSLSACPLCRAPITTRVKLYTS